jgi:hypothetical protein
VADRVYVITDEHVCAYREQARRSGERVNAARADLTTATDLVRRLGKQLSTAWVTDPGTDALLDDARRFLEGRDG